MAETKINANQTTDIIIQYKNMPTASANTVGKVYQYIGATTNNLTNYFFYKGISTEKAGTTKESHTFTYPNRVSVNSSEFMTAMNKYFPNHNKNGENRFVYGETEWGMPCWKLEPEGYVIDDMEFPSFDAPKHGIAALGITITGGYMQSNGDTIIVTYTPGATSYSWEPIATDDALHNLSKAVYYNRHSLTILGTPTEAHDTITIGDQTSYQFDNSVVIGTNTGRGEGFKNLVAIGSGIQVHRSYDADSADGSVIIGHNISATDNTIVIGESSSGGRYGVSIGYKTSSWGPGVTIGANANGGNGIAIGQKTVASGRNSIQLSGICTDYDLNDISQVVNNDANTFKVANANGNFEIMSADGTIPAARHASLPSTDGTYVLKLVIANGVPTLSWVAE